MISRELFSIIHKIEITTNRLVTDVFAGQYHSVFKGRGMEFDEVREYIPGDDIRSIDWNVTARTGRPHVKKYIEERELTVMLVVDASRSCHFASQNQFKSKLAAEIAAVLSFSAIRNNDKVGLIFFTNKIEKFIPPRKGTKNVLRLVREILHFEPQAKETDLSGALEYLSKVTTRRSVAFLISDFFEDAIFAGEVMASSRLKKNMTIASRRHDLIAITLNDPRERELPDCGLVNIQDAETGQEMIVDCRNHNVRRVYRQQHEDLIGKRKRFFQSLGIDQIDIRTDVSYTTELIKFFTMRRKRLR